MALDPQHTAFELAVMKALARNGFVVKADAASQIDDVSAQIIELTGVVREPARMIVHDIQKLVQPAVNFRKPLAMSPCGLGHLD